MMEKRTSKQIERLISGLENGTCILFLGPELIKFDGKDYNSAFFEELEEDDEFEEVNKKTAKYDENEKLWTFKSMQVKREFFYLFDEYFKKNRNLNNSIFHKLASMPFPLIVSLLPDRLIDNVFSEYKNFEHHFCTKLDNEIPEITEDKTVIYNIYGNIENQDYVCSHFDYMNFIISHGKTSDLPSNFTASIAKANYLIFLGFEMDKWYNIILLYILNEIKQGQKKYIIEEQNADELLNRLLDENLNSLFIEHNNEQFIDEIYLQAKEKKLLRNIVPKAEYLKKMILSNQDTIEKSKERINLVEPIEQQKLKLDIELLENDNKELEKQLKELKK